MDPGPVRFSIVLGRDPHHRNPLLLPAKMSESERNDLESGRRDGLASAEELDTMSPGIRYGTSIHQFPFLLLTLDCWRKYTLNSMPTIMRSVLLVVSKLIHLGSHLHQTAFREWKERKWKPNTGTFQSRFFADTSCDTPLKKGSISILRTRLKFCSGSLLGPRCFTLPRGVKFDPTMVHAKAKDSSHTQVNKPSPIILVFMGHHARCLW